jgi:hypothetical protein
VIRQVSSQLADFLRLGPTPASSDEVGCSAVNRRVVRSSRFRINSSKILGDDLSRLVHQRAARKPISDARTATYVILSTGSGPGGRWFKSIRPDHFFRVSNLQNRELQRAPSAWPGGRSFESISDDDSFSSQINALRYIFDCEFYFILRTTRTTTLVLFGIWKTCPSPVAISTS